MTMISIPVPEDLEDVLKPVLERDPAKGAEWLQAGFETRLTELYQQWQALHIRRRTLPHCWVSVRGNWATCCRHGD
jgi:hypothetical protein